MKGMNVKSGWENWKSWSPMKNQKLKWHEVRLFISKLMSCCTELNCVRF